MSLISVRNVSKRFGGNAVINDLSIGIKEGDCIGLIGPNGAGKTSFINMISGFISPDSGSITLLDEDITNLPAYAISRRGVRRTFQTSKNFGQMDARSNMMVPALAAGLSLRDARKGACDLISDLELSSIISERADNLSGGQKKLVEIASCFITKPKIVIMDEPFSAVHVTIKEKIKNYIIERNSEGQTFIVISHDISVLKGCVKRLVVMDGGAIVADGAVEDVVKDKKIVDAFLGGGE